MRGVFVYELVSSFFVTIVRRPVKYFRWEIYVSLIELSWPSVSTHAAAVYYCITVHYCVLLCITVYYCALLCITVKPRLQARVLINTT